MSVKCREKKKIESVIKIGKKNGIRGEKHHQGQMGTF